ncbi:MAG: hypothetical protein F9K29_23895 [Hyphomicrobiaceae bacterium]|nr:MAG: hypothetical protein F9K29_23895 [Hyphomicrobiaceae bacterium]
MTIRGCRTKRRLGRGITDFAVALVLFWIATFAVVGGQHQALAVPLPTIGKAAHFDSPATRATLYAVATDRALHAARASRARHNQAVALLSVTIAGLIAFNLAFWRHLRRAYASPRRGVWRRG